MVNLNDIPITLIIILAGLIAVSVIFVLVFTKSKQAPKVDPSAKVEALSHLIPLESIKQLSFVRNKINLTVDDVQALDLEAIKATGITALNIVGPTLKFHYASHTTTEAVYQSLEKHLER